MGILDKIRGVKKEISDRKEDRRGRQEYKHEMEREKWKYEKQELEKKSQYYQEKREYETKKAEVREQKIKSTPVIGALYSSAKKFDAGKFARATTNELRPPQRQILTSRPRSKVRKRRSEPQNYSGFDESMLRTSIPEISLNSMPHIDVGVGGKRQSRAYKQPSFSNPKIDPKLRKLMGV